ncbi:MAG: DMSO reductase [Chromatiales bacterium 21-64-14]|nr:MAG: DMSO reductase [Chromatiales bacterium 21-64-14]HQU15825.1 dimethyl sulfoxide reductase anchor subunit [Gammaproteobacteria bacterium]
MRPAFSVIYLTTLIGAGQGLFLALYTSELYSVLAVLPAQSGRAFYALGSALALLLLVAGLIASFFHLGRPERAWRSAARWRTSWLSREVIALPVFMAAVFTYGALHFMGWNPVLLTVGPGIALRVTLVAGTVGVVLCLTLFVCTGMIYACLRFLQEWATPLTVVNFTLLGCASGFTLATAYAAYAGHGLVHFFGGWALILTALSFAGRSAALIRNARLRHKSSLQTAIGVRHTHIRQISQGAMGGSFNTREFFHGRSAALLRTIKWGSTILVFAVPAALLATAMSGQRPALLVAAFVLQYLGLLGERWLFFAQAEHPQNLYYQAA